MLAMPLSTFSASEIMKDMIEAEVRRKFLKGCMMFGLNLGLLSVFSRAGLASEFLKTLPEYNPDDHKYGMGINVKACIGCGRCVLACKNENKVPPDPFYFRTWIEKYTVLTGGEVVVDSPNGGMSGFSDNVKENKILKSFYVPKLCNHCLNPPCVQVCPVGATFSTPEGVVLVDKDYCIGCSYCIQACPYGARFLNPVTHTTDKCTFCYHRVVRGLLPACVEVCPTQARVFGDTRKLSSILTRFFRFNEIQVLKPDLNTDPQVFYARMDGVVR